MASWVSTFLVIFSFITSFACAVAITVAYASLPSTVTDNLAIAKRSLLYALSLAWISVSVDIIDGSYSRFFNSTATTVPMVLGILGSLLMIAASSMSLWAGHNISSVDATYPHTRHLCLWSGGIGLSTSIIALLLNVASFLRTTKQQARVEGSIGKGVVPGIPETMNAIKSVLQAEGTQNTLNGKPISPEALRQTAKIVQDMIAEDPANRILLSQAMSRNLS